MQWNEMTDWYFECDLEFANCWTSSVLKCGRGPLPDARPYLKENHRRRKDLSRQTIRRRVFLQLDRDSHAERRHLVSGGTDNHLNSSCFDWFNIIIFLYFFLWHHLQEVLDIWNVSGLMWSRGISDWKNMESKAILELNLADYWKVLTT